MRRHLVTMLIVGALTLTPVAAGSAGAAPIDTLCTQLTSPDFGQLANKAQAELQLGHYEASLEDAPRALRKALRRVVAHYRRLVDDAIGDEIDLDSVLDPSPGVSRAIDRIFAVVERRCST